MSTDALSTGLSRALRPWRRSTWWTLTHLVTDLAVGTISFSIAVVLLALSIGLLITLPLALPVIWLLFVVSRGMGVAERSRFAALLGVEIADPVPPLAGATWWARFLERIRSRPRWLEIAYQVLLLPLGVVTFVVAVAAWSGSVALLVLPAYVAELPGGTAKFGVVEVGSGTGAIGAAVVGLIGIVLVAPWLTVLLGRLDTAVARRLIGPSRRLAQEARLREAETGRVAAVDSAEAERRRIERDLHDGAQQRLVSLAMQLGSARERLEHDPEGGRELVDHAHQEAKAALQELRDLVRGIHPVILEDRGLDAALSAIVARAPVPVSLEIHVPERPPAPVESAAYFVVSEALTNVARHSRATNAAVSITRDDGSLAIEVRDNGDGGADPDGGTGLKGLRDRVASLGGTMQITSPAGGPTTLRAVIPCE